MGRRCTYGQVHAAPGCPSPSASLLSQPLPGPRGPEEPLGLPLSRPRGRGRRWWFRGPGLASGSSQPSRHACLLPAGQVGAGHGAGSGGPGCGVALPPGTPAMQAQHRCLQLPARSGHSSWRPVSDAHWHGGQDNTAPTVVSPQLAAGPPGQGLQVGLDLPGRGWGGRAPLCVCWGWEERGIRGSGLHARGWAGRHSSTRPAVFPGRALASLEECPGGRTDRVDAVATPGLQGL